MARLPELLEQLEDNVTARGGVVHWARDAHEANRIVTDLVRATGADEVVKVKSMATQEIGLNEALEEHGHRRLRDRPRRADRPARRTTSPRTSWCRRSTATGPRSARSSCAEMADAPADLTDEPRRLAMAARAHLRRKFLSAKVAVSGANFGVAETGTLVRRRVRGQRPDVPDPAGDADHRHGHREAAADLHRPRGVPAAAAPLLDRGADEPVHLAVDRGHPRRRAAGVPPGAAGQRAHRRAGRRGRAGGAALHPLLRLPERLPGLRAYRRARLRLGLPGPDRRGPHPAADRHRRARRPERVAAVRVLAVRRLLRRLPGEDRHPHHAGRPARPGGRRRPAPDDPRRLGRRDEGRRLGDERREAVRRRRKGSRPSGDSPAGARAGSGTSPHRCPGGPPAGTYPPHPPRPSGNWWKDNHPDPATDTGPGTGAGKP